MNELVEYEWLRLCDTILDLNTERDIRICRTEFLRNIRNLVSFDYAAFVLYDPERTGCRFYDPVMIGTLPAADSVSYYDYYYQFDYVNNYLDITSSMIYLIDDLMSEEEQKANKFLQSFDTPCYIMENYLANAGGFLALLTLYRFKDKSPDFTDKDLFIMRTLAPHLENSLANLYQKQAISGNSAMKKQATAIDVLLSDREKDVCLMILDGASNRDIAEKLSLSESTVKKHVSHIFSKYKVKNRIELLQRVINK